MFRKILKNHLSDHRLAHFAKATRLWIWRIFHKAPTIWFPLPSQLARKGPSFLIFPPLHNTASRSSSRDAILGHRWRIMGRFCYGFIAKFGMRSIMLVLLKMLYWMTCSSLTISTQLFLKRMFSFSTSTRVWENGICTFTYCSVFISSAVLLDKKSLVYYSRFRFFSQKNNTDNEQWEEGSN